MLNSEQVLKMVVGLKEVGDLDVIGSESVIANVCRVDDRPKILAMASIIEKLLDEFDYERSPEFLGKINGKSEEVTTAQRKLLTTEKKKQLTQRLGRSLSMILSSGEAYVLIRPEQHVDLDALRALASSIASP